MIFVVALVCVVGIAFYCFRIGKIQGFQEGVQYSEDSMDEETLLKKWRKLKNEDK